MLGTLKLSFVAPKKNEKRNEANKDDIKFICDFCAICITLRNFLVVQSLSEVLIQVLSPQVQSTIVWPFLPNGVKVGCSALIVSKNQPYFIILGFTFSLLTNQISAVLRFSLSKLDIDYIFRILSCSEFRLSKWA